MGLFDFFKKKGNRKDLIEEIYHRLMTILHIQSSMFVGSLVPKDSLPKIEWIYGYLFGHIDFYLQISKLKDDDDAWRLIVLRVFRSYFGDKDGDEIYNNIPDLLKNNSFLEGQKIGGQDLHDFVKKGEKFPPMGMVSYFHKKYKEYKKIKKVK
jgi:hypothetical protein